MHTRSAYADTGAFVCTCRGTCARVSTRVLQRDSAIVTAINHYTVY